MFSLRSNAWSGLRPDTPSGPTLPPVPVPLRQGFAHG